jgi:ABC-type multidrug transport system fused ATPase/permease subunit
VSGPSELNQLWSVSRQYYQGRATFVVTVSLAVIVGASDVLCPWLLGDAIDTLLAARSAGTGSLVRPLLDAGIIGGVIGVQFLAHYAMVRLVNALIYRGSTRLRLDVAASIDDRMLHDSGVSRLGDLLAGFMADIQQLQDALLDLMSEVPFDLVTIIGLGIAMLIMSPRLGTIVLGFLVLMVAVSVILGRHGWGKQRSAQEQAGAMGARVSEGAAAARTLAALGARHSERSALEREAATLESTLLSGGRTRALVAPFFGLSEYLGLLMVLIVGGWFMLRGELTVGGLVCMLAYMEMVAEPVSRCGRILPRLQKAAASAVRVRNLIDRRAGATGSEELVGAIGRVRLESVSFAYPGAQRPALKQISLAVEPGQVLAVVGRNGAGKSTLLDLLLRLRAPTGGRVLIDDVEIASLSPAAHSRIVGVVPQDVILLNRSVADNIALGLESRETVSAAADAAGLHEMLDSLPQGLDTPVGERGATLSGGQRQRIAIARVVARDPRIVILDEPTSALDALSEAAVLPALRLLCRDRAVVLVSHRKPLLELADRVLLLEHGQCVADGAPDEVWERQPGWRDLFPAAWARPRSASLTPEAIP